MFLIYSSKITSYPCEMATPKSHLVSMWNRNPQPKVVSHECEVILWLDVTAMVSKVQRMNICRNFSLHTAQKTPHIQAKWHPLKIIEVRWECPHKVRMAMQGGCKVRMAMWGDFVWWRGQLGIHISKVTLHSCKVDMRWEAHTRWTQGENAHASWEWLCKVDMRWEWPCEVEMRWKCPHKVDARWEWPHKVRMPMQGGRQEYERSSEILHCLIF